MRGWSNGRTELVKALRWRGTYPGEDSGRHTECACYEKSECRGTRFFVVLISLMTVGVAKLTRLRLRWLVAGSPEQVRLLASGSLA